MKLLIVYTSHGGASKTCCELLRDKLTPAYEVSMFDARADALPNPEDFDVAVVGGSIRMGSLDKGLKKYIKENAEALSKIPCAAFICCGLINNFEEYRDIQFPKSLSCSLGFHCFGGELKPEKLKGMDKLIVKAFRSSVRSEDFEDSFSKKDTLPEILPETVIRLADRIRDLL